MNSTAFRSAILSVVSVPVWEDFIPEKKPKPAVSYSHISNGGSRVLNGKKVSEWDTWRIVITVDKSNDIRDSIIDQISGLDNTTNPDFKRMFVLNEQKIPSQPEDDFKAAMIDFRVYDR